MSYLELYVELRTRELHAELEHSTDGMAEIDWFNCSPSPDKPEPPTQLFPEIGLAA